MLVVSSPAYENGFGIMPPEAKLSIIVLLWAMTEATFLNPIPGKCLYQRVYLVQDEKYDLGQDERRKAWKLRQRSQRARRPPSPVAGNRETSSQVPRQEGEAEQMWFALTKDHRFFLITTFPFYGVSVNYCQFRHLQSEPEQMLKVQFKMICVSYNNLQYDPQGLLTFHIP